MIVWAYIQACRQALDDGTDASAVITSLDATLSRRGHTKLRPRILRMLARILDAERTKKEPHLSVARMKDVERYQESVSQLLTASHKTSTPRITIRPEIIGGFVLSYDHTRIDKSYKRVLHSLYKNITKRT